MRGVIADSFNGGKDFVSKELRRSVKRNTREVRELARSVGELVDIEEFLKTIHKRTHPEEHEDSDIILHQASDWMTANQSKASDHEKKENKEKTKTLPDGGSRVKDSLDSREQSRTTHAPHKSTMTRHGSVPSENTHSKDKDFTRKETAKANSKREVNRHNSLPVSVRPRAFSTRSMK